MKPERPLKWPFNRENQESLGRQLRETYGQVSKQSVPDRFVALLRRLDDREDDARTRPRPDGQ
jgi:hypothetical protein